MVLLQLLLLKQQMIVQPDHVRKMAQRCTEHVSVYVQIRMDTGMGKDFEDPSRLGS